MAKKKSPPTREAMVANLEDFIDKNEDEQGLLSEQDQLTVDTMLAGIQATRNQPAGFTRQGDIANKPAAPQGQKLVDEKGRVHRTLTAGESFLEAVRENPRAFEANTDYQKLVDDGLTPGDFISALFMGPKTGAERLALADSDGTAGGYTVPEYLSAMMIDLFRARLVLQKAGAQTLALQGETHTFAKLTSDPTPSWRRELTTISQSDPTFGALQFQPKSLAVIVKASRELLQDSPNIGSAIERCISQSMAAEVDRVGMFGTGATEPVGLQNLAGLNEITGVGALADYSDFVDGYKLLLDDNVPDVTAAIHSNREWATLANLADTTGQPLNRPPAIANMPFLTSAAVPTTLGGGSNESLAFMGYFNDLILGYRSQLQIEQLNQLYAETLEIGFVAWLRMDVGLFRPESICRLLGITP